MPDKQLHMQARASHNPSGDQTPERTEDRAARVAALKRAVSDGTYQIRTQELAKDIVDSLIHSVE